MIEFWRRYRDGAPEYLARNYWWAYLNSAGVWFFDHYFVINSILFGQYRNILDEVIRRYSAMDGACTLQLACAYGSLTPALAQAVNTRELHLLDVAAIQLRAARRKIPPASKPVMYAQINAETLAYSDNSFDAAIIFFLLHELPGEARQRALRETLRVLKPGGCLLIAEYGANRGRHPLHRLAPLRRMLEGLEPFLGDFWHGDLGAQLAACARDSGKALRNNGETEIFGGFYRVVEYRA
jgi:ubiquinone/menaquinone biosynthesis C-methylase UbiE